MLTARGSNQELISKPGHLPRASSAVEEVVAARTSLSGPGDHSSAPAQVFIADSLTNQHGNSSGAR
jgi:hypothetical protein